MQILAQIAEILWFHHHLIFLLIINLLWLLNISTSIQDIFYNQRTIEETFHRISRAIQATILNAIRMAFDIHELWLAIFIDVAVIILRHVAPIMDSISEMAIFYAEAISRFKIVPCAALKAPILSRIELLASKSVQEWVFDAHIHRGIKIE